MGETIEIGDEYVLEDHGPVKVKSMHSSPTSVHCPDVPEGRDHFSKASEVIEIEFAVKSNKPFMHTQHKVLRVDEFWDKVKEPVDKMIDQP